RALEHISAGRIIVMPSELGQEYVASALNPDAVHRLRELAGAGQYLPLALGHASEIFHWLPFVRGSALRLARRFWPGPIILLGQSGVPWGLWQRLPPLIRSCVTKDGTLALRRPAHQALSDLVRLATVPLVVAACSASAPTSLAAPSSSDIGLVVQ